MKAGPGRREQGERVVIRIASQEGDDCPGAVRQLEPERPGVEVDLAVDVGGEEQDVAQPSRCGADAALRVAALRLPRRIAGAVELERGIGGMFGPRFLPDIDEVAVGIADPHPALGSAPRRIDLAHAGRAERPRAREKSSPVAP